MLSGQAQASVFDPCLVCGKYLTVGELAVVAINHPAADTVQLFHPRCWDSVKDREPSVWREFRTGYLLGDSPA